MRRFSYYERQYSLTVDSFHFETLSATTRLINIYLIFQKPMHGILECMVVRIKELIIKFGHDKEQNQFFNPLHTRL